VEATGKGEQDDPRNENRLCNTGARNGLERRLERASPGPSTNVRRRVITA
jgi:hypothetical protein